MSRIRVKMCGITRLEDAECAIAEGADALGFVFYPPSPRCVSKSDVREILCKISPFISKVALFVNQDYDYVHDLIATLPIDMIQFHGDETPEFCEQFNKPYIKALRVREDTDIDAVASRFRSASGLLVDAFDDQVYGGSGQSFDWKLLPDRCKLPIILAGGLRPDNVAEAIQVAHPYAVDVSSGIESSKGIKDPDKISAFMKEVRRVTG